MSEMIEITLSGIKQDLANGVTRCKGDTGYSEERGSIEEKYGLSKSEVKDLFKDSDLIGIKVRVPKTKRWVLIKDQEPAAVSPVAAYGVPSATAIKRMASDEAMVEEVEEQEPESAQTNVQSEASQPEEQINF
jgi:hypothetical protein